MSSATSSTFESIQNLLNAFSAFVILDKHENELETMKMVLGDESRDLLKQMTLNWFDLNTKKEDASMRIQKSARLRKEGNKIFTAKGQKHKIMEAALLYTEAIFEAPSNSEVLALAYANRAATLQEFGYFQQAYDDCVCAFEQGCYPEHLKHKLWTRQANCAWKIGDAVHLKKHLDDLEGISLPESFKQKANEMRISLTKLEQKEKEQLNKDKQENDLNRGSQKIMESFGTKGRYMIATKPISENDVIFNVLASNFVPLPNRLICQECAAVLFIPIPCPHCSPKVVYCSLKCRTAHALTHTFECPGYQRDLFNAIGISHLALRMVIEGLPRTVKLLQNKENANDIWAALMERHLRHDYAETLQMTTHLCTMKTRDILRFASAANFLILYLKEFTKFFDFTRSTAAPLRDWELIAASLILRHIGQLIVNAHTCQSITVARSQFSFCLMTSELWSHPFHLQRGRLHTFCDYEEVAAANFPYLSLCNHACMQSFQPKFSGRYVSAYATSDIKCGDEIYNCYTQNYLNSKKETRKAKLQNVYKFTCHCSHCTNPNVDEGYEQHHRYICENQKCRRIFIPHLPNCVGTLNWWETEDNGDDVQCTFCGTFQKLSWFYEFNHLVLDPEAKPSRQRLYTLFKNVDHYVVDYHTIKLMFAIQLLNHCFSSYNVLDFTDNDYNELVNITKFMLCAIAERSRSNSIEYVSRMTYLWDIIALGKYKCPRDEMKIMLNSIEIISDEFQIVFMNYYRDYIEHTIA